MLCDEHNWEGDLAFNGLLVGAGWETTMGGVELVDGEPRVGNHVIEGLQKAEAVLNPSKGCRP